MEAGYTFLNASARNLPTHLWVIVSDPEQDADNVLIVNLTSWKSYHDQTCILRPGDHPWIQHDSCVNYPDAKVTSISTLEGLLSQGLITPKEAFDEEVREAIRARAGESEDLRNAHYDLLRRQGLVE